jgi:prefoldin subunit 5
MPSNDEPRRVKLASSFKSLAQTASELNSATKQLSKTIQTLDDSLKNLNLGISSWLQFSVGGTEDGMVEECHELGYAKINGKWGLAIRYRSWLCQDPDRGECTEWLYADASRDLRLRAIDYIPDLIEKLNKDAQAITTKLNHKIEEAELLAKVINSIGGENNISDAIAQMAVKK